ncbi:MAG: bacteriophage holin [Candidatus Woesearchaeota archaeon]
MKNRGDVMAKYQKISPKALGLSLGIVWAVGIFLLGILPVLFGDWGKTMVLEFSSLYIGYGPSFGGAIIGAIWGFVDGLLLGLIVAWLYNKLLK